MPSQQTQRALFSQSSQFSTLAPSRRSRRCYIRAPISLRIARVRIVGRIQGMIFFALALPY